MKNPFYPIHPEGKNGTNLDCPDTVWRVNVDTYKFWKWLIRIFTAIGLFVSIIIIATYNDCRQSIASAFLGGVLSTAVWLLSVHHTDIMQRELNQIDSTISDIDNVLRYLHTVVNFINPVDVKISKGNVNNLHYRNIHLIEAISHLKTTESIDSSELQLKWYDKTDCSISEFESKLFDDIHYDFSKIYKNVSTEDLTDIILWNEHCLETELLQLRDKQLKRKTYILCGNAPLSKDDTEKRFKWADKFDHIFNKKESEHE